MRVYILCVALLGYTNIASAVSHERYASAVFEGDLSWMPAAIAEQPESPLAAKFTAAFVRGEDPDAIAEIDDPLVRSAASLHLDYWRTAFLQPPRREEAEAALSTAIASLLQQHGIDPGSAPLETMAQTISARGYGFRGGRTKPLLDFMLWRSTDTRTYPVELSDGIQQVTVHFIGDFVLGGWSRFATFGVAGTGGWADPDALYCVADQYDLQSERFLNSYLRHEGRHYADYALYPSLGSADLEYRGKLTELIYASDPAGLLGEFARHANASSHAPHPLANSQVIAQLARGLGSDGEERDSEIFAAADAAQIAALARTLLSQHDAELTRLGARTTTGVIMPRAD